MEDLQILKPMKKIIGMLDILICLLLFISTLYKGCFYKEDSLFINLVICMLGLICLSVKLVLNVINNKKVVKSKTGSIIDVLVMLLPIAYFLPVVFGKYASLESAIFESIRYVNFVIIYFIVRTTPNKKIYITSLVLIGLILAVLGIDEMTYRVIEQILEPVSISYSGSSLGKLSSTLQYANITSLVMLMSSIILQTKLINNFKDLKKSSNNKFKILVALELFGLMLLQSAIVLTTSRMNIFLMIVTTVGQYILNFKYKRNANMLIFTCISSILLVTSIEEYLLLKNYLMVYFTYIVTLILICVAVNFVDLKKCNQNNKNITAKIMLVIGVILIIISILPGNLRLNDNSKEGSEITRNIYCDFKPSMDFEVDVSKYRNNDFRIELYEIDKNFNKKIVVALSDDNFINNNAKRKINISNNTIKLELVFKTFDSDVSIDKLSLNGKNITLSYKFASDTIIFRLKDTLMKDSNNSLRFTYYLDALKLFNESKLIGIGGEGFKARYQQVQSQSYISSEAHSAPIQMLVETGIFGLTIFIVLCVLVFIIIYRLISKSNHLGIMYLLLMTVFLVTALFDIVLSYGIMIYILAILIGLIIGEYKNNNIFEKDKYELDNKSSLGMLKIAILSISLMTLFIVTIYSLNIYRASIIIISEDVQDIGSSYEKVGVLETKLALDKYNLTYLTSLLVAYDGHIDMLNNIYINSNDEEERKVLTEEINSYLILQKQVADNIIEYEYYNKYAIDKVARCYLKRYMSYTTLNRSNFKNDEIAYTFYVGYAIKLTDWITKLGPKNKVANDLAYYIYTEYLPALEKQNKVINSNMLELAIKDMKNKLEILENNR